MSRLGGSLVESCGHSMSHRRRLVVCVLQQAKNLMIEVNGEFGAISKKRGDRKDFGNDGSLTGTLRQEPTASRWSCLIRSGTRGKDLVRHSVRVDTGFQMSGKLPVLNVFC